MPTPQRAWAAVLMPVEDVYDLRHGRDGAGRARVVKWGCVEIVGYRATHRRWRRGGDVSQDFRPGEAGDNIGVLLRGGERRVERGQVLAKPADHAAHAVCGGGVCVIEDEGAHAVFRGIGRSFTFARRCDGGGDASGGTEMVMPGTMWRWRWS